MEKTPVNHQNIEDLVKNLSEAKRKRYDELQKRREVIDDLIKQHNDDIAEWNRIISSNVDRSENLEGLLERANNELGDLRGEYRDNLDEVKAILGIDKSSEETMKEIGDELIESLSHTLVVDQASGLVTDPDRLINENA